MKRTQLRIFMLLLALALLLVPYTAALAEGETESGETGATHYVYDLAGVLSDEEWYDLDQRAQTVSSQWGCGVYLVTVEDYAANGGESVEEYAEWLYHHNLLGLGQERNGIMLLLSMAGRDYDICAYGSFAHTTFTDYAKDRVMPQYFLGDFRRDDWYNGFYNYIAVCDELLRQSAEGNPVDDSTYIRDDPMADTGPNTGFIVFVALFISVITALISCAVMKGKLKTARMATEAGQYMTGARLAIRRDTFSHATEHVEVIETPRSDGGGGGTSINSGGFSHSSGKF